MANSEQSSSSEQRPEEEKKKHALQQPSASEDDAHDLFPEWLRAQTPDLTATRYETDPTLRCRFFTPDSNWTWYVIEAGRCVDLAGERDILFFGYVEGLEKEFGYFSRNELASIRGPMGMRIERDLYFAPRMISHILKRSPF